MSTIRSSIRAIALLSFLGFTLTTHGAFGDVTGITGSGAAFSTMQPSLGINYLISTTGIFPTTDGVPNGKFLGEVSMFAGNFAPGGWALANGQLLPISQNTALFSILGTTYGGDGITTFALPDLRGRTVIGTGQGAGLTNRSIGDSIGVPQVSLLESQMPDHDHILPGGGVTGFTGGNQPFTTMQPSLALNTSINLQGIFPSQGGGSTQMPFLGQLNMFAGTFQFTNTPNADGQLLPISQNTALFSILGTTYGGNGVSTFQLPDLQGRAAISAEQGPGLSNRFLGEQDGQEQTTLTVSQLAPHSHTLPGGGNTGLTGGGLPFNNMQPSLTLHNIIALTGIFPSQGGGGSLDEPMLGQIELFAGNFAPSGWAFADGQILPISQNTALFSILGTTYGGNGINTFALPDLRGRTAIGMGQGPGLPDIALGEVTGTESVSLSVANLPPHDHTLPAPEPSTIALAVVGMAGALFAAKRRRCAA
ncbi:MAG TPA: tail fiber protein [Pirellulales bacterium]|nr:tail fiber protein [Pirellulales bacterium]